MGNEKVRVVITNKQKKVKIPTGIRMLVRRACTAVLKMEEFLVNFLLENFIFSEKAVLFPDKTYKISVE